MNNFKYFSNRIYNLPKKFFFVLFVIGLLNACSGLQTAQDYLLNDNEGLAFFSMTESGNLSSSYQLTFLNESTQRPVVINLRSTDQLDIGYQSTNNLAVRAYDNPRGKLVVLRLPEGVYRFDKWSSGKSKLGKHSLDLLPGKKFRVMNGRALYLGNIHLVSSNKLNSLFIRDNRIRDFQLFSKRYPRVENSKILVSSGAFLEPAVMRDRVLDAYTSCNIKGYGLTSKKRLPAAAEKFRILRIASKEKKVSRLDGYRLKYIIDDGPVALNMKVELSEASQYVADKKVIKEWMENIKSTIAGFKVEFSKKDYFSEYQMVTNVLDEKRMLFMVIMLDDTLQIITNISFINPPEYMRKYKTVEEFLPVGKQLVNDFQQCVFENLNKNL